jgi:hypothetical protein
MIMSTMPMRPIWIVTLAAALLASAAGCGSERIERRAVSGSVQLDGQPLAGGTIIFTPLGQGPSAGGKIENGMFSLSKDRGPSLGKYRVEISAYRPTGKTELDAATGERIVLTESIIPPEYNRDSKLEVEVTAHGENRFDFKLPVKK